MQIKIIQNHVLTSRFCCFNPPHSKYENLDQGDSYLGFLLEDHTKNYVVMTMNNKQFFFYRKTIIKRIIN